jgi:hypothetical protein
LPWRARWHGIVTWSLVSPGLVRIGADAGGAGPWLVALGGGSGGNGGVNLELLSDLCHVPRGGSLWGAGGFIAVGATEQRRRRGGRGRGVAAGNVYTVFHRRRDRANAMTIEPAMPCPQRQVTAERDLRSAVCWNGRPGIGQRRPGAVHRGGFSERFFFDRERKRHV